MNDEPIGGSFEIHVVHHTMARLKLNGMDHVMSRIGTNHVSIRAGAI
ncbi:hypothetical protein JOC58_000476 [Paenibacillus hunanensis]|uniref:Uncharacterized protein n=1 Tax=Paenibacillus hunanensis TaxID=539262 RepID=A0ABU1IW45_9BACL|nr:hypothetical protein [Paenibacillus hunanensis]